MLAPSTQWQERIAPDEESRYAGYARDFAALQARKSARYGKGRALHRKAQLALAGELEILPDLPSHARHGLFAEPGRRPVWVRLSNGGADRQSDRQPDIRGFSIKVRDVAGPGALGGDTDSQDFLLINHAAFSFPNSDEFVGLALAAIKGPGALLRYLVGRYGLVGGLRHAGKLAQTIKKPFSGFATEPFHSAAPIACGPYAVKVRLLPASGDKVRRNPPDWSGDVRERLARGALSFDLQLLFFVNDDDTPIEDASKEWTDTLAPAVTVARLTLPPQDPDSEQGRALAEAVEEASFDPWRALDAHRPLGDVMRARKVVYFQSQQGRAS
jgi:hypothetical protein